MNEAEPHMIGHIPYSIARSGRARGMRITIYPTGAVRVTVPYGVPLFLVNRFVARKKEWILSKVDYFLKHPVIQGDSLLRTRSRREFLALKEKARALVKERIEHFNAHYDFEYKNVAIRNQRSRWGSCSHKGNLNFNYKIVHLPSELQDYIVVHELCHLKQLNHSRAFWDLVGERVPEYKELRKRLRMRG